MQAFAWTPDDFAALERRVEHLTSNLELKRSHHRLPWRNTCAKMAGSMAQGGFS